MRSTLNARPRYGVHAVLTGACSIREAATPTQYENVDLLDAEGGIPNPGSILDSRHYAEMLSALKRQYRYIIVDTPPVTAFADAAVVASKVDATILVAREGYTDKRDIQLSSSQLRNAGANIIGVAFNGRHSGDGAGYDYYYYYDYYEETVEKNQADLPDALVRAKHGKGSR